MMETVSRCKKKARILEQNGGYHMLCFFDEREQMGKPYPADSTWETLRSPNAPVFAVLFLTNEKLHIWTHRRMRYYLKTIPMREFQGGKK